MVSCSKKKKKNQELLDGATVSIQTRTAQQKAEDLLPQATLIQKGLGESLWLQPGTKNQTSTQVGGGGGGAGPYIAPGDSDGKDSASNAGDWVPSLGSEDPLEKGMAVHSSVLAWRISGQRSLAGYI